MGKHLVHAAMAQCHPRQMKVGEEYLSGLCVTAQRIPANSAISRSQIFVPTAIPRIDFSMA